MWFSCSRQRAQENGAGGGGGGGEISLGKIRLLSDDGKGWCKPLTSGVPDGRF